uniref:Uncharacterized protein n=1 Tax=Arundo donax TaxID=35708 RepID=A0A0A9I0E7_ARUDO
MLFSSISQYIDHFTNFISLCFRFLNPIHTKPHTRCQGLETILRTCLLNKSLNC